MGCVGSKDASEGHANVFRVIQIHEGQPVVGGAGGGGGGGQEPFSGQLEVSSTNLTLYRKRKPPTQWPLQCLRRYGYENDTFIFEAGRRCKTGEGIYSFRCRRADVLFNLLQDYIQESTYNNNNNNMTVNSLDEVQQSQERMDQDVAELRRALVQQQAQQQTSGSNYIILHGNSNNTAANSGSGGPTQIPCAAAATSPGRGAGGGLRMAVGASTSPCNSPQNVASSANNNNYLEPLDGTSTSPTPTATAIHNNSNNIYTNSIMIPSAASASLASGNVYHQLALAQSSPAAGSLKQQQQLQSGTPAENSPAGTPGSTSGRPLLATSESLMRLRSTDESQATSPTAVGDAMQQLNTYMNVTPGEMILLANSNGNSGTATNSGSLSWRYTRMSSGNSSTTAPPPPTAITERCYENLDPSVLSAAGISVSQSGQLLANSASSHMITASGGNGRAAGRHSRPDIFSKVDLPMIDGAAASMRMSEPCTPTSAGGIGSSAMQQRKVNYIVLDLDSSQGQSQAQGSSAGTSNATTTTTPTTTTSAEPGNGSSSGGGGQSFSNLLTPDSPTKKRQTLGYATIDFNRTVALSNSTNPTCESEASRKTRF